MKDHSQAQPGGEVFRWAFTVSSGLSVYFIGTFLPVASPEWLPPSLGALLGLACSLILVDLAVRAIRQGYPTFLATKAPVGVGEGLVRVFLWSLPAYLTLALVLGTVAYLRVSRLEEHWALILLGLTVWVPLWLCIPPAALFAWWRSPE